MTIFPSFPNVPYFTESGDLGPILQPFTSDDLARYLEALSGQNEQDELMFPSLDAEQKRFAGNIPFVRSTLFLQEQYVTLGTYVFSSESQLC